MTRRIAMVLASLLLGACAASAPRNPPLAISYHWDQAAPLPTFDNQPPAEISISWQPGTLSPEALEQIAFVQCLSWNRQPSRVERQQDSARFRCDKPLTPNSATR